MVGIKVRTSDPESSRLCGAMPVVQIRSLSLRCTRVEVYSSKCFGKVSAVCLLLVVPSTMDVDSSALVQQLVGEFVIELLAGAFDLCGWTTWGAVPLLSRLAQEGWCRKMCSQ